MSKRIGQALIERGLLEPHQLEAALSAQLIWGGHLGTCLIELGLVAERELGRTLAELAGVRPAAPEMLDDVPPAVVAALDADTVRRMHVVPFGLEGSTLHVAVVDPRGLHSLSSTSGYRIVPYLAPEIRVLAAMEKYYGIPRRRRFVRLADPLPHPVPPHAAQSSAAGAPHGARRPGGARAVPSAPAGPEEELAALSDRLSRVDGLRALGEVLLDWLVRHGERGILFGVDGEGARPIGWRQVTLDPVRVRALAIPVTPWSLFGLALDESFYLGVLPREVDPVTFCSVLGIEPPVEAILLPVYGERQLEAIVYVDGGPRGQVREPTIPRAALLDRVALAMRMLALKRELRGQAPEPSARAG